MRTLITGTAYVLGDHIDTDQIIPAEHLVYSLTDPEESKKYGMYALSAVPIAQAGLPDGNIPFVKEGEYHSMYQIIIGGINFGCGSSREHAPFALQKAGVRAIIAESYARIFYRNCVDGGFLLPYESTGRLLDRIATGDLLELHLTTHILINHTSGDSFQLKNPDDVLPIIDAGGLFEYARKSGMI
ncbi:MAG: 3-isopropylmalate dehydratase [Candidatus Fischerbacteria bacterium RBG_13_37_8]|uniref:3-isopropylmalate dehydratase n=1 Tax=Candidatus Fischerbacteria bacterium RBG_13_37_8 TaxID=1817863 RepID=A0A1F5VJV5_9BACT|nr:MAG: 3-isopropylmalate dehydratase [Candidatus Fischerbacteria bacterium RBG_13_37_8]